MELVWGSGSVMCCVRRAAGLITRPLYQLIDSDQTTWNRNWQ